MRFSPDPGVDLDLLDQSIWSDMAHILGVTVHQQIRQNHTTTTNV